MGIITVLHVDEPKLINTINALLVSCIDHGGDGGGPYFNNPEEVNEYSNNLLKELGIDNEYEIRYKSAYDLDWCSMRMEYPVIQKKIFI